MARAFERHAAGDGFGQGTEPRDREYPACSVRRKRPCRCPDKQARLESRKTECRPASPWQGSPDGPAPPPDAPLDATATEAVYRVLWKTLRTVADVSEELPAAIAVVACVDLAADLSIASGILWQTPDIVAALRTLADDLERRPTDEPAWPMLTTVKELFAHSRPELAL
jgi:hypothetical protein